MSEVSASVDDTRYSNETDSVICCPSCLRPYFVPTSMSGKLARCVNCDAHFTVNVTELKKDGEPAIVLSQSISVRVSFIQEGCAAMARNIRDLLKLAGEPLTPEAVTKIVKSIPYRQYEILESRWREGRLNKTMKKAFDRCSSPSDEARLREIADYFVGDIPLRDLITLSTLVGAFVGVLDGLDSDQLQPHPRAPVAVKKRGWLERWAERNGW